MTAYDDRLDQSHMTLSLEVTIRPLRQEDLPKLEWYGQFRHFRHLFQRAYEEQQAGRRYLLVADCRGFPIGRMFVQFAGRNKRLADGKTTGYLYSLHVMELFQGQGIGSRLIKTGEHILSQRGFKRVTIAVAKDNTGALRLYQRHHYIVFDEDDGRWRYLDHRGKMQWVDEPCWLLEKAL